MTVNDMIDPQRPVLEWVVVVFPGSAWICDGTGSAETRDANSQGLGIRGEYGGSGSPSCRKEGLLTAEAGERTQRNQRPFCPSAQAIEGTPSSSTAARP